MNYDVVFHVDLNDEGILNLAISNISNYLNAIAGQKADVILLVNGPAVNLFKKENAKKELAELQERGLQIQVCNNAIKKFSLSEEMLMSGITVVPAGIVELVRLQNEHFSYVKP